MLYLVEGHLWSAKVAYVLRVPCDGSLSIPLPWMNRHAIFSCKKERVMGIVSPL